MPEKSKKSKTKGKNYFHCRNEKHFGIVDVCYLREIIHERLLRHIPRITIAIRFQTDEIFLQDQQDRDFTLQDFKDLTLLWSFLF